MVIVLAILKIGQIKVYNSEQTVGFYLSKLILSVPCVLQH